MKRRLLVAQALPLILSPALVRAQQIPNFIGPPHLGGPPPGAATWSPTNKNGNVVLSNANMTAAYTIDGSNGVGLATVAITTGQKVRVEISFDVTSGGYMAFGLANSSESTADGDWLGIDTNGIGYRETGEVIYNNSTVAMFSGYAQGDIIDMDVDFSGNTVEWFVNGSSVGSHSISVTGDLYPAYDFKFNHTQVTLIASGSFTYAPPTGYTEYGA